MCTAQLTLVDLLHSHFYEPLVSTKYTVKIMLNTGLGHMHPSTLSSFINHSKQLLSDCLTLNSGPFVVWIATWFGTGNPTGTHSREWITLILSHSCCYWRRLNEQKKRRILFAVGAQFHDQPKAVISLLFCSANWMRHERWAKPALLWQEQSRTVAFIIVIPLAQAR